jgi:hypothetical protein
MFFYWPGLLVLLLRFMIDISRLSYKCIEVYLLTYLVSSTSTRSFQILVARAWIATVCERKKNYNTEELKKEPGV